MTLNNQDKEWIKSEIHKWAEKKYAQVGKWTVNAFLVFVITAFFIMALELNGWVPPWSIEVIKK